MISGSLRKVNPLDRLQEIAITMSWKDVPKVTHDEVLFRVLPPVSIFREKEALDRNNRGRPSR
jgi:hypothetical protein